MARKKQTAESFSDQLRNAVRDCGTTRYALAKQLDISESTLSRFLSGERGLTLDSVDKLADVLGLRIVVTVQKAARPVRRGPKRKQTKSVTRTETNWALVARTFAADAHDNYWSSRRGIWYLEDVNKLCIYNNNPYANYPNLRAEETAAFRDWLKVNDIKELAYATYPATGECAGFTYAMIINAGAEREAEITDELRRILVEIYKRMNWDS